MFPVSDAAPTGGTVARVALTGVTQVTGGDLLLVLRPTN